MLIHSHPTRSRGAGIALLTLLLTAAGFALGYRIAIEHRPDSEATANATHQDRDPTPELLPRPRQATGELPLLEITIAAADWQKITAHRERALAAKFLFPDPAAIVPATIRRGDRTVEGTARLKGDWTDHYDTDQWSLRIELDEPLQGMRRFSIQHPKTRGYVMEWLVMRTAEKLGVLAPRVEFVHASINGREPKVYYLEERPGKEMLEARGRRDGPIVKFGEDALWSTHKQLDFLSVGVLPSDFERMYLAYDAPAEVMSERRLAKVETLNRRIDRAVKQARDLQALIVAQDLANHSTRVQQSLAQLQGRTVDDLFVTPALGRLLALYTFYQGFHGLLWNQLRLYHDPVRDRLEPIANDSDGSFLLRPGEIVVGSPDARWFRQSPTALTTAYEQLGEMTEPGWAKDLMQELRPELLRAAAAMKATGIQIPGFDVLDSLDTLMRQQVDRLAAFVRPEVAATFDARVVELMDFDSSEHEPGPMRAIEVDVRATTKVPTRIDTFVLSNGRALSPALTAVGIAGEPDTADLVVRLPDDAVLLPTDGRALRFRFPLDGRLAGLSEVQAMKRAIRQQLVTPDPTDLTITARYRPVSEPEARQQELVLRTNYDASATTTGRPTPPSLWQALEQHAFLTYDLDSRELRVLPGSHVVEQDVILPDAVTLHIGAGTELVLAHGTVLVMGAMRSSGTATNPVKLRAADPTQGFEGILVLGTAGPSVLTHTEFSHARAINRGGWQTTGGITFLAQRVELTGCHFHAALGEDALNLIGTRCRLEGCRFTGGPSDLFDGDFVSGEVLRCHFRGSGEDALDVSGSVLSVSNCTFVEIGDKALSVGEGSRLTARDCRVRSAAIAMASKDRSRAVAERLTVDRVEHFVFASYIKKPEFGASQIEAKKLTWNGAGKPRHLAQTTCTVAVDGQTIATEDIDVGALYRAKVLGK